MTRIAVNGLGRIGRAFVKAAMTRPELEVIAVNDLGDPANLTYLLRFDSVHGRYGQDVSFETTSDPLLKIGASRIRFLQERDPARLPWAALDIDVVVEATGTIDSFEGARAHLAAGAKRVVLTAPAKDADGPDARTALVGVNMQALASALVPSNASCTTNSASSVIQVLQESIGVRKAMLNTVHGYTATQSLVDAPARGADMRRGRAAAVNIVPASTGAAIAVTRAIPALAGLLDGVAMRVPVAAGSLSAIAFLSARPTTVDEINSVLEAAAGQARWSRVLAVTHDQVVSSDIVGDPHAAIVDLSLTRVVDGDLCSVYSWYDNEVGYAQTLVEHVLEVARHVRGDPGAGLGTGARRSGMATLTEGQRAHLERRLLEERGRIVGALDQLRRRLGERAQDADGDLSGFPLHPADQGSDMFDRDVDAAEETRLSGELHQVDAALGRLYADARQFGRDERTGEVIPFERLDLVPWARQRAEVPPREPRAVGTSG